MLGDEAKRRPEMMQDFIASQVISAYRWMGLGLVDLEGGGPGDQPVKRCDLKFGQARPRSSIGCLFNGGRPGQHSRSGQSIVLVKTARPSAAERKLSLKSG